MKFPAFNLNCIPVYIYYKQKQRVFKKLFFSIDHYITLVAWKNMSSALQVSYFGTCLVAYTSRYFGPNREPYSGRISCCAVDVSHLQCRRDTKIIRLNQFHQSDVTNIQISALFVHYTYKLLLVIGGWPSISLLLALIQSPKDAKETLTCKSVSCVENRCNAPYVRCVVFFFNRVALVLSANLGNFFVQRQMLIILLPLLVQYAASIACITLLTSIACITLLMSIVSSHC